MIGLCPGEAQEALRFLCGDDVGDGLIGSDLPEHEEDGQEEGEEERPGRFGRSESYSSVSLPVDSAGRTVKVKRPPNNWSMTKGWTSMPNAKRSISEEAGLYECLGASFSPMNESPSSTVENNPSSCAS